LPSLVELVMRSRTDITAGARYTTSTLMSYVIISVGIISALSAVGLHWSELQWLIAALGVGIGFGLQEIVANFISGLIILFERPIRVGDVVTIGDNSGEVSKIRIRATTIRDWDGKELLVPNKEFITGQLLNWSLSDSQMRISIPVGIAYGSDVEQALKILGEIVADHPSVLGVPEPTVIFEDFGDNALELSARFFLGEYRGWREIATELRREIYKRFTEAGIVIAFPQQDVHLDSEQPIRIVVDPPPTN
jgi:potassium efflux system protein